jgi:hypothetical protein
MEMGCEHFRGLKEFIVTSVNLVYNAPVKLPPPILPIAHSDFLNCGQIWRFQFFKNGYNVPKPSQKILED